MVDFSRTLRYEVQQLVISKDLHIHTSSCEKHQQYVAVVSDVSGASFKHVTHAASFCSGYLSRYVR